MTTEKKTRIKSPAAIAAAALTTVANMEEREYQVAKKLQEMGDERRAFLESMSEDAKVFYDKLTA